jgi:hypothetical protein
MALLAIAIVAVMHPAAIANVFAVAIALSVGAWDRRAWRLGWVALTAEVDRLLPALPDSVRIGGSGVQRDMVEDTAITACLRAGRQADARKMLRRRFAQRR